MFFFLRAGLGAGDDSEAPPAVALPARLADHMIEFLDESTESRSKAIGDCINSFDLDLRLLSPAVAAMAGARYGPEAQAELRCQIGRAHV